MTVLVYDVTCNNFEDVRVERVGLREVGRFTQELITIRMQLHAVMTRVISSEYL